MDFLSLVLYLLLTFALLRALLSLVRPTKPQNLPPGPTPLPIIGNLLKLGSKPHKSLAELAKTHGPIMTLKLGHITTVVISSSTIAKEVLQKQDLAFSTRSVPNSLYAYDQYQYSVVWLPISERWRSLRKVMNLNIFAGNKLDIYQHLRCQKIQELLTSVHKSGQEGVAVDIGQAAFKTSLNLLSNTIFSVDLADPNEDSGEEFRDLVLNIMELIGKPNLVDYFPELAKIDPQGIRRRMKGSFEKVLRLFGRLIDERLEKRRLGKTVGNDDLLDVLLNISEENGDEIDRTQIERLCMDLFNAGTDTTSSTVEWAMTELLRNPEVVKKAKVELENVIGKGKSIEESDVGRLPYLQAIVKETLRIHPPAPFLIPREVNTDVEVSGYKIPKGTKVLVNAWAISRDPNTWPNATSFMPERFLDSEIDFRGRDFEFIPFGAGRRICPGLPLAIRMIPLMLGSLINSFDWKLENGIATEDLDMEDRFGITLQKDQPLRVIPIIAS
ncbi:hypothetical protein ACSBR1_025492 [Camellia fascicularis]